MATFLTFVFLSALVAVSSGSSLSSTLTLIEQQRIVKQFQKAPETLQDAYLAVTTLKALGKDAPDAEGICAMAISKADTNEARSLFQLSEISKALGCKGLPDLADTLVGLVTDDTTAVGFSHVVIAMVNLGYKVDDALVKKFIAVAKDNDSPSSAAASFYAASLLPKSSDLKPILDMVEDIIAQADEVDSSMLQFEGGLSTTSGVVRGIVGLSDQQGKSLLKQDQAIKFSKYLLSRKFVYQPKDIQNLVLGLAALAKNKHQIPVVVSVHKTNLISPESPLLKVRVTNVLDQSIPEASVSVKEFAASGGDKTLYGDKPMVKSTEDDFIVVDSEVARGFVAAHAFELNVLSESLARGLYTASLNVEIKKDTKLFVIGGSFDVPCKVLARVSVEDFKIGVSDKDASTGALESLKFPQKVAKMLEADTHQKVVMSFVLKEVLSGDLVTAHQTFVRLTHEQTGQEIFFVAEPDSDDNYKFNLDVGATAKDSFNNLSGKYKMAIVIGDASIQVPINWNIGVIALTFSGEPKKSKKDQRVTVPKPVIEHMFRVPEKRPSKIVSTAFTVLIFVPLIFMLAVWVKAGANMSNFQLSLSTLVFHLGLCGVFGLYYMFWIQLDMFQTLKLLMLVGGLTFLGGNKMLAQMAAAKNNN